MLNVQKETRDHSNYTGLIVLYLASTLVAFVVILPGEEFWYFGIVKALIWPLYSISKMV